MATYYVVFWARTSAWLRVRVTNRKAVLMREGNLAVERLAHSHVIRHAGRKVRPVLHNPLHRPLRKPIATALHVRRKAVVPNEAEVVKVLETTLQHAGRYNVSVVVKHAEICNIVTKCMLDGGQHLRCYIGEGIRSSTAVEKISPCGGSGITNKEEEVGRQRRKPRLPLGLPPVLVLVAALDCECNLHRNRLTLRLYKRDLSS